MSMSIIPGPPTTHVAENGRYQGFFLALAAGQTVRDAARDCGLSERTAYRRARSPGGQRLIRRVFALLRVDLLFLFAIVFAMVVKPTGDDVWAIVIVAAILVAGSTVFLRGIRETSTPEASATTG